MGNGVPEFVIQCKLLLQTRDRPRQHANVIGDVQDSGVSGDRLLFDDDGNGPRQPTESKCCRTAQTRLTASAQTPRLPIEASPSSHEDTRSRSLGERRRGWQASSNVVHQQDTHLLKSEAFRP